MSYFDPATSLLIGMPWARMMTMALLSLEHRSV